MFPPDSNPGSPKRVLIVDDSLTVRKVVLKSLENLGFKIDEASNALEGLEALNSKYYDLVFLDYILPDLSAAEFLERVLQNTDYARLPVILMSSKGAEIRKLGDYAGNVVETLTKPFPPKIARNAALKALNIEPKSASLEAPDTANSTQSRLSYLNGKENKRSETYTALKKGLSRIATHIPALEAKRGTKHAKDYYLPFLLHPDLVKSLEKSCKKNQLKNSHHTYSGNLEGENLLQIMREISTKQLSGHLEISTRHFSVDIFIHKGFTVGASSTNPSVSCMGLDLNLTDFSNKELSNASNLQESNGTPLALTLLASRESGILISDTLRKIAISLINAALKEDCSYKFIQDATAPEWATNNSIGIQFTDLILEALRRFKGWEAISDSLGELSNHFTQRFKFGEEWILPHLTPFESVVHDFSAFNYSTTELASTLGENPTKVAETMYLLMRLGLVCQVQSAPKSKAEHINGVESKLIQVVVLTEDTELTNTILGCLQNGEVEVIVCDNAVSLLERSNSTPVDLLITDGNFGTSQSLDFINKFKAHNSNMLWIFAEPNHSNYIIGDAIRLGPYDCIDRPFNLKRTRKVLRDTIEEIIFRTLQESMRDDDYFNAQNRRLSELKAQLEASEKDLQQRENELLRNEEIFFHKCNLFEEERAKLDVLSDQVASI